MMSRLKIGVFDSGIGGMTVLKALRRRFPAAQFVYYGDTANLPYGSKSPTQILKLTLNAAAELRPHNLDALVIACNTASAYALEAVRKKMHPVPVFGVIAPQAFAAAKIWVRSMAGFQRRGAGSKTRSLLPPPIVVFATRAAVKSKAYRYSIEASVLSLGTKETKGCEIFEKACPLLVPLIEEGWAKHSITSQVVREYVSPFCKKYSCGVAILGCTHYPWIQSVFARELPGWRVLNSADAVAAELMSVAGARATKVAAHTTSKSGRIQWIFSDPEALPEFAKRLL